MDIILTPFAKLILLFYDWTGSYGISLLLFCLVIRLILFPVFLKGRKSMLSMSGLAALMKREFESEAEPSVIRQTSP